MRIYKIGWFDSDRGSGISQQFFNAKRPAEMFMSKLKRTAIQHKTEDPNPWIEAIDLQRNKTDFVRILNEHGSVG